MKTTNDKAINRKQFNNQTANNSTIKDLNAPKSNNTPQPATQSFAVVEEDVVPGSVWLLVMRVGIVGGA